ncbi:ABC transporter substrate-binding protein, partial [Thermodesulfobacteriota bacterium]
MKNTKFKIILVIYMTLFSMITISYAASAGAQHETVEIGAILPLTGPGAVFAEYIKEGVDLAVEEINEKNKDKITILYEDSKNMPKEGISAYNKIVSSNNVSVTVVALSSVAKALSPLAEKNKSVQIYIAVAIPDVTDGKYTFRIYPEANGMAGIMSEYAASKLMSKTAAVIYINDDFGRTSLESFKNNFETRGGKVVFSESYELLQKDFRNQIAKLKNVKPQPDIIYLSGYGPAYSIIIKQLKELEVKSQLTADMTMGLPITLKHVGEAAEGAFFVDGDMSDEFIVRFKGKYGKKPTSYAGYAYDIINIVNSIMEEKKSAKVHDISEGLINIKNYNGAMGNISILPNGDASLKFSVKKIENGNPVNIN